jgi:hypothetical protein
MAPYVSLQKPFGTLPMIGRAPQTRLLALLLYETENTFHYEVGSSRFIDSHTEIILKDCFPFFPIHFVAPIYFVFSTTKRFAIDFIDH